MSKKLDLASQQFIGYYAGKWGQLIGMIEEMGLTEKEWIKLQKDYSLDLTDLEIQEINEFFNPPKGLYTNVKSLIDSSLQANKQ